MKCKHKRKEMKIFFISCVGACALRLHLRYGNTHECFLALAFAFALLTQVNQPLCELVFIYI